MVNSLVAAWRAVHDHGEVFTIVESGVGDWRLIAKPTA
jgi:hypothetical protein